MRDARAGYGSAKTNPEEGEVATWSTSASVFMLQLWLESQRCLKPFQGPSKASRSVSSLVGLIAHQTQPRSTEAGRKIRVVSSAHALPQVMAASSKELKNRIDSVANTQKITDAMKLVAAAKVRRAQDAVVNGRPFAENLVKVMRMLKAVSHAPHSADRANIISPPAGKALRASHTPTCCCIGALRREPAVARGGRGLAAHPDSRGEDGAAGLRDRRPWPLRRLQQPGHPQGEREYSAVFFYVVGVQLGRSMALVHTL